jgi:hypothetical protein
MGSRLPPAIPSYRVDKASFYELGGKPFCRVESGGIVFDLHGDWAVLIAGLESGKGLLELLAKQQSAQIVSLYPGVTLLKGTVL